MRARLRSATPGYTAFALEPAQPHDCGDWIEGPSMAATHRGQVPVVVMTMSLASPGAGRS